jgi:GT2 family glycosyltransferase/radical SAM superfamily enzyme YgiQ (UPF0313 family)/thioredoxin-like negative regulator of GroEL
MRAALINSPSLARRPVSRSMAGGLGFDGHEGMVLPPLDLALMAATLRDQGDHVDLIDADPLRLDEAAVHDRLASSGPWDALIATVSLPTLEQDATFVAELRRRHPQATIAAKTLIQDHPTLEALLKRSGAHFVIYGEADLSIGALLQGQTRSGTARLEPAGPDEPPTFKVEGGEPVGDLNQLPLPARDLLPNDRYTYPLLGGPVATLQTSRGCPYPCGYYCPYPLVEGVKWRAQSAERIANELKDVVERFGITKIYFRDATFTLNEDRVARLCELIVKAAWRLEWVCETRVDCLSERLLEQMREAGCVGLLVGIETGDEHVMHLREGKKGLTVPKIARLREWTRRLGIRLHFLLIVGLPHETRESIVDTYDLVQRYQPDTIGVTIITPYPGTPLYEQGLREGWIDSQHWQDYGGHQVPMHTPSLTREDLLTGKRMIEDGFAILQRRRTEGVSQPIEAMAGAVYTQLLRWAYRLDEPLARLRAAAASAPVGTGATSRPAAREVAYQAPAIKEGAAVPQITVVIPTYNRRAILKKTLLAFAAQTLAPDLFDVIVADDGSDDDTLVMLQQFKAPFVLRALALPHRGANAARNEAIRQARGEIILITGDDMIPEPALAASHLKFHRQHPSESDALLGFIDWSPEIAVTPFMKYIVSPEGGQQFAFHEVRAGRADFRLFYTSNLSLKRSLLHKQPTLFDPDFTYPAYDDIELGYRLERQGLTLHYDRQAVTTHYHPMTARDFAHRQRQAGRMAVILARKHPELDERLLSIQEILQSRHPLTERHLNGLLAVLAECEKPALNTLGTVRMNGVGFDHMYIRTVLYPLYDNLLRSAYALGVWEAAAADRENSRTHRDSVEAKAYVASIIVPVFNKVELTQQCLVKLAEVTQDLDYEVIVVDNHSTDGTAEFLSRLGGDVQVIRNQENLGFAKACNQGARAARGRSLVFLNNDTIPLKGWLTALVQEVERHPDVAVVGSKLLYEDGTIQHAGVAFSRTTFSPYHIYRGLPADSPAVSRRRELQCVTAACMLVRRDVFASVGGFDEGYRNGFEDVDLCLQIHERGWRIVYQPESVLYHLESRTPGRKDHEGDNARRLLERWRHKWWLPDEDTIYVTDGYAYRVMTERGLLSHRLEPLTDPTHRQQWEIVAEAQRLAQRQDWGALHALLAKVDEWPDDAWVLRWAARVCSWSGVPEQTAAFWRKLLTVEEASDARVALARRALEQGHLDEADSHLEILLSSTPTHGEGWLLSGILAMQRQAFGIAQQAFRNALKFGGDPRKARLGLCMAALGEGQAQPAWEAAIGLLRDDPDDAEGLHWLLQAGTTLEWWSDLAQALHEFLDRNPGDLSVRFALAGVLLRMGFRQEAWEECQRLQLLDPHYDGLAELALACRPQDPVAVNE